MYLCLFLDKVWNVYYTESRTDRKNSCLLVFQCLSCVLVIFSKLSIFIWNSLLGVIGQLFLQELYCITVIVNIKNCTLKLMLDIQWWLFSTSVCLTTLFAAEEFVFFVPIQHRLLEVELVEKFWKIGCLTEIRAFNKTGLCCHLISKENQKIKLWQDARRQNVPSFNFQILLWFVKSPICVIA